MQVDEQIALVRRFMLRVAPAVARHSLDIESRRPLSRHDEEESERISEVARQNAKLTLQLAMHLAGTYAQFEDETQETAPTPNPAPKREPHTPQTAPGLQSAAEILPSPFPGVPSVRHSTQRPDPPHPGPAGRAPQ